jgi:hypothetical protein
VFDDREKIVTGLMGVTRKPAKRLWILPIVSCSLLTNVAAQGLDTTDYFPLDVGNTWIYLSFEVQPYYYPDTVQILRKEMVNDTLYFVQNRPDGNPHGLSKYLRKDSAGNVFGRISGKDQMIYSVSAEIGTQWKVEVQGLDWTITYTVTLEGKSERVTTHAGVFENCLRFLVQTFDVSERTYYVWLAPAVGEIRRDGWGLGMYFSLKRAVVNSELITPHVFQVYSVSPPDEAKNVDVTSKIFFFSGSIPSNTIADSDMTVLSRKKGKIDGVLSTGSDGWVFIFTPEQSLPEVDTITVTLSARIADWFGDSLDGNLDWNYEGSPSDDYRWRFFTGTVSDVQINSQQPIDFHVCQNYPNPFNSETNVEYLLPTKGVIDIEIYDLLGRHVRKLPLQEQESGWHRVVWDARDDSGETVASGVYLVRLQWHGRTQAIHAVYLR